MAKGAPTRYAVCVDLQAVDAPYEMDLNASFPVGTELSVHGNVLDESERFTVDLRCHEVVTIKHKAERQVGHGGYLLLDSRKNQAIGTSLFSISTINFKLFNEKNKFLENNLQLVVHGIMSLSKLCWNFLYCNEIFDHYKYCNFHYVWYLDKSELTLRIIYTKLKKYCRIVTI